MSGHQYKISKDEIFQVTNGGLDVFRFYIPDIDQYVRSNKKFKIREEEKTPSCSIKLMSDGNYIITDFGSGEKFNAITFCQYKENIDFGAAIKLLANQFGISSNEFIESQYKAGFETTPATPDQAEGETFYDYYDEIPESHLRILFSKNVFSYHEFQSKNIPVENRKEHVLTELRKILKHQHWHGLKSYTIIKNRKAIKISAAEYYPIFVIEEQNFKKIYQPKAEKKSNRFFYRGDVDSQFLHGLEQVKRDHQELVKNTEVKEDDDNPKDPKFSEIIFSTGGSDALNLIALGYKVIYPCSEYFKLTIPVLRNLFSLADDVMTCPDLDATGQKLNLQLCLDPSDDRYLDIKTISLPEELGRFKDQYGRSCKDVRDFFNYFFLKDFRKLVSVAKPLRFWDMHISVDREGNTKTKFGKPLLEYKLSSERVLNFLEKNGFAKYKVSEDLIEFVHQQNNVVKIVKSDEVKAYLVNFLRSRYFNEDLINVLHRSPLLSESNFSMLVEKEFNFTDFDKDAQYFFFKNETWKVSAEGIEDLKPHQSNRMVWEEKILDFKVKKLDPMFQITKDEDGTFDIDIINQNCMYFRFLIQASRVHWKKELEDNLSELTIEEQELYRKQNLFNIAGPNLSAEERHEQKMHLINKMFAVGYLLHRYKDPSRAWAVFAMDNKFNDDGLSYGGTGKSMLGKAIAFLKNTVNFDGKNDKLFEDNHTFEQVNKKTDIMSFNDANQRFKFERLFAIITDELTINPKGRTKISLPFNESPKIYINTNYTPSEIDPSTLRRLLFIGFSDYYHIQKDGEYAETKQPIQEFGKNLFSDYTEEEWNYTLNFLVQCCSFYLSQSEKIDAPMGSIMARNLASTMGLGFLLWADVYFSEDSGRLNCYVPTSVAINEYLRDSGVKSITAHGFNNKLKLFAQYKKLIRDPEELCQKDGRIIKMADIVEFDNRLKKWFKPGGKKSMQMIYLATPGAEYTDTIYDPTFDLDNIEQQLDTTGLKPTNNSNELF